MKRFLRIFSYFLPTIGVILYMISAPNGLIRKLIEQEAKAAAPPISGFLGAGLNPPQYPNPPEFCFIQKQAITNATTLSANTDGVHGFAQQFTPSSNYTTCKIMVHVAKGGVPTGSITVALMTDNPTGSGSGNPCPNGVLYAANVTFASLQSDPGFASADVSVPMTRVDITPTALTSGTRYWIVCFDPQGSIFSGNYLVWYEWGPATPVTANQSYTISATFPPAAWEDYNDNTQFRFELKGD